MQRLSFSMDLIVLKIVEYLDTLSLLLNLWRHVEQRVSVSRLEILPRLSHFPWT